MMDLADTSEGGHGCEVTVTWEASGARPEHGTPDVSVPLFCFVYLGRTVSWLQSKASLAVGCRSKPT